MKDSILNFLFPNHACLICKGELNNHTHQHLCNTCAENLPFCTAQPTLRDEKATQHFKTALAAFSYDGDIVPLILSLKYSNNGLVASALAPFMAGTLVKYFKEFKDTVLIPVPLSKKRAKKRGYNQAELLAKEISQVLDLPVLTSVLERTKSTEAQVKMTVVERAENLKNAFEVKTTDAVKNKNIIIVDDVFTSGATVNECARVLIKAGATAVNVITVASA